MSRIDNKLFFSNNLAVLLEAGVPLLEALETLKDSAEDKFGRIIGNLSEDLSQGSSLKGAMEKHPSYFNSFYLGMVEMAENSGNLPESLKFLAKQLEKEKESRAKLISALMYPSIVVGAMVMVGGLMMLVILPQLIGFFEAFEANLPLSTKILLAVAEFSKKYGSWLLITLGVMLAAIRWASRLKAVKIKLQQILVLIPMVGGVYLSDQLARFCRNLSILIQSGIPIGRALEITQKTTDFYYLNTLANQLAKGLDKGQDMAKVMETLNTKFVPKIMTKMVKVGEKTGSVDRSLEYLGRFFEGETDKQSTRLGTLLEPILLLAVGLGVGFTAVAIISPIYQLTSTIGR